MGAMLLITICLLFSYPSRVFSEFTSLSCGSPTGTTFRDKVTDISYNSDTDFISTGVGSKIKSSYQSKTEQKNWYLRSFPQGLRNCYSFYLTSGERYLIRTTFLHGGYDNNSSRRFELHLGVNPWTTVSTANETEEYFFEMIHLLTTDRLQVCLVKTGDSTPFISALELRKLNSEAYNTSTGSLQTFLRADVGSISNQPLRYGAQIYGADVFDRIWLPYNSENWSQISTNSSVDVNNEYKPPETAMITASVPTDPDAPMNISLTRVDPASRFYAVLHFSEIQYLKSNETREFIIMYNGRLIGRPDMLERCYTLSYVLDEEFGPNANGQVTISIQRTVYSTLPPLLSAMEIYLVKSLVQKETDTKDVEAILDIKSRFGRKKIDWEGDPCVPPEYMWNGLKCSYKQNRPASIVTLNLTGSDLTGGIPESVSNLTKLETLDLSNNNLTGSVPEFLANMESLKFINLSSNELNGSIPKRLLDRAQRGLVTLSVDELPGLCSSPSCATTSKKDKNKSIVVASVATTLFLVLLIAAVIIVICKRKRKADRHPSSENNNNSQQWHQSSFSDIAHNVFTYEDLAQATCNFSSTNLIGEGGFGYVHKGVLSDGTEVAIKQLKAGSRQGKREFLAEIEIISRVHHKHLVSLLGYCITGSQRLLVYEFVPNKTLEFHLHEKEAPVMEWANRMKIALGSAKGLSYLHDDCNPKTIHRNVKAANILIDNNYEAKLADFGLARSFSDTETHVSTRVMGTFGYLAPEYASSGKLTDKSDVFSFGVVLLQMITGRRPFDKSEPFSDDDSILDWAKPLMTKALNDGNFDGFVDPRLENDFDVTEMSRVVACAAASVRHSAKRRPTMTHIVRALEGNISLDDIAEGFASEHSTGNSLDGRWDYCSTQNQEDLKKFKKIALESQTFGSSSLTSENGQNVEPSSSSSITQGHRNAADYTEIEN